MAVDLLSAASVLAGARQLIPTVRDVAPASDTLDCRTCEGSGQGEAISHFECRHCDDCNGTGVRTCDAPGCYEAAVVAPDGNADYCDACGRRIASAELRTWALGFFGVELPA